MLKLFIFLSLFFASQANETKILAFAGSTRTDSLNKKLVREAAYLMGSDVQVIDLADFPMPLYDGDLEVEQGMPETVNQFRKLLRGSHVVLIASPEYNHSLSGLLKNALDWASRTDEGKRAHHDFQGIKFILLSASPSKGGGKKGLAHLKEILEDMGGEVLPVTYSLPLAHTAFDEEGHLLQPERVAELQALLSQIK